MRLPLRSRLEPVEDAGGVVLRGHLWCGDGTEHADGRVVFDEEGTVVAVGASTEVTVPYGALELESSWVGPGVSDAHVHLAFGDPAEILAGGVVAVRDLGAPPRDAATWRSMTAPRVEIAGPLLTAPGGYPSRTWGRAGFAGFVDDPDQATRLVAGLAAQVDVIKLALEPAGGPVPAPEVCATVVASAHEAGRRVVCHALTAEMVRRALDAGVDELAHTPTERLPDELVERIVTDKVEVVSTLQTFVATGDGAAALDNARAFAAAGVPIRYGTDLGNADTRPGVDPRELELLADEVGLGPEAALRAATEPIVVGRRVGVVGLDDDPRSKPATWQRPRAVTVGGTLLVRR